MTNSISMSDLFWINALLELISEILKSKNPKQYFSAIFLESISGWTILICEFCEEKRKVIEHVSHISFLSIKCSSRSNKGKLYVFIIYIASIRSHWMIACKRNAFRWLLKSPYIHDEWTLLEIDQTTLVRYSFASISEERSRSKWYGYCSAKIETCTDPLIRLSYGLYPTKHQTLSLWLS